MIRYPGSKAKIANAIISRFPHEICDELFQPREIEYREPFFGSGAIGFAILERLPDRARVLINDRDWGIRCLWQTVLDQPTALQRKIMRFKPTVDDFYRFKEEDGKHDHDILKSAFQKFALHQISFSGNGVMAGGPIGGREQRSEFNVDCRWNNERHCREVDRLHRIMRRFGPRLSIQGQDFERVLAGAPPHCFIYADPPYYEAGPQLYKHSFTDEDHRRLAGVLQKTDAQWALSYDDHPFIRGLYEPWADLRGVELTYTTAVAQGRRRKNSELIISPRSSAGSEAAE